MSSMAIEKYLDKVVYDGGSLTHLEKRAARLGDESLFENQQLRVQFQSDFDRSGPEVAVFFVRDEGRHVDQTDSPRICISRIDFNWLMEVVHVHPAFIDVFQNKWTGACVTIQTQSPDQRALHIAVRLTSAGFVEGSFYIRFELFPRKRFVAIFFGDDTEEQRNIMREFDFRNLENDYGFPVLLPILKRYADVVWSRNRSWGHNIAILEALTGRGPLDLNQGGYVNLDGRLVKSLHHWGGNLRVECSAWDFQIELIRLIREAFLELFTGSTQSDLPSSLTGSQFRIYKAFQIHEHITTRRWKTQTTVAMQRAASQISAVDQLLNQKANEVSAKIASESANIASESRKDSKAMKVISLLGIVYLPTSLIASICSTVFINQPSSGGSIKVDPAIWKFLLTCLLLTMITLVAVSWKTGFYKQGWSWFEKKRKAISSSSKKGQDNVETQS